MGLDIAGILVNSRREFRGIAGSTTQGVVDAGPDDRSAGEPRPLTRMQRLRQVPPGRTNRARRPGRASRYGALVSGPAAGRAARSSARPYMARRAAMARRLRAEPLAGHVPTAAAGRPGSGSRLVLVRGARRSRPWGVRREEVNEGGRGRRRRGAAGHGQRPGLKAKGAGRAVRRSGCVAVPIYSRPRRQVARRPSDLPLCLREGCRIQARRRKCRRRRLWVRQGKCHRAIASCAASRRHGPAQHGRPGVPRYWR